jgi:hypothetical protein
MINSIVESLAAIVVCIFPAPQDPAAITHPYYPLRIGSEWTYRVSGGSIKVQVADVRMLGTQTGFVLETCAGGHVSARETIGVTKDGVFRFEVNDSKPDIPIMLLRSEARDGDTWTIDTSIPPTDKVKKETERRIKELGAKVPLDNVQQQELNNLIDFLKKGQLIKGTFTVTREKVTVPKGAFDALCVTTNGVVVAGQKCSIQCWFAKNVGMVKVRFILRTSEALLELEEYKPGE